MNEYSDYFKNHYNYDFSYKNIKDYYNWFYCQFNFINKKIKVDYQKNILEIGSSIGGFYNFFKSDNYVGLELDSDAVSFSNNFFKVQKFYNVSFEDFITNKKFDYAFAFEVLEHMDYPNNNVKKIYDVLNDGGFFIGTSPYPYKKNIYSDKTHKNVLYPNDWLKIFFSAGFRVVTLYPMSFFPFLWRINKHLNIRIPFYIPFNGFISTCLIIAQK